MVDVKSLDIIESTNLQKLLGEIRDRDMKRRVTSLFTNKIIPFEYPISTTGEELGEIYRSMGEIPAPRRQQHRSVLQLRPARHALG